MKGKYVLVRATAAGVHVGTLAEHQGQVVRLTKSRRIWSWTGALTLSELAVNGLNSDSKVAVEVPDIWILDACEIIEVSSAAATRIAAVRWSL